jgi:amino-acid N-acetyltransferase
VAEELNLRPARPGDLSAVRALLETAALPLDGLEDQFPAAYVVAVSEGRVVGAAGVETHGPDGLLRSVVVDSPLRGVGLGERLARDRIEWSRAQGLASLWLLTTTAAGFFPRLGFLPADRASAPALLRASREFTSACPASAACQRLPLAAG